MKLSTLLKEGPVKTLKNSVLGSKFYADAAELHVRQALQVIKRSAETKEEISVEELSSNLREALRELRALKRMLKSRNV